MTFDFTAAFWGEATRDREAELEREQLVRGKIAVAGLWPFLAEARSEADFGHRLALVEDQIEASVHPSVHDSVLASIASDWKLLHEAQLEIIKQATEGVELIPEQPIRLQASHEFFNHETNRWERVSYIDPSDGERYNRYPVDPVDNGPLQGPDGFVQDLAQGEGRSADAYAFQTTPGAWTVTPGTEWPVRPNAGDPGGAPRVAARQDYLSRPILRRAWDLGHEHGSSGLAPQPPHDLFDTSPYYDGHRAGQGQLGVGRHGNNPEPRNPAPQFMSSQRVAGEGVAPTPGPNPNYFSQGTQGLEGPPSFPENPSSAIEPKTDNHVDDTYGAVPPQVSSGSAGEEGGPYTEASLRPRVLVSGGIYGQYLDHTTDPRGRLPLAEAGSHKPRIVADGSGGYRANCTTCNWHGKSHAEKADAKAEYSQHVKDSKTAVMDGRPNFRPGDRVVDHWGDEALVHNVYPSTERGKSHRIQVHYQGDPEHDPTLYFEQAFKHHPDLEFGMGRAVDEAIGNHPAAEQFLRSNPQGASHLSSQHEAGTSGEYLRSIWDALHHVSPEGQAAVDHSNRQYDEDHEALQEYWRQHPEHIPGRAAATNGRIVGQCDHCGTPVRFHTDEGGKDELRHLHSNSNNCDSGGKRATSSIQGQFFDPSDASVRVVTANKYIEQRGDKWVITQKGTGKVLSHHDSEEDAEASFRAMMQSKHGVAHIADDTRVRPTVDNPTGAGDEFQANTWDNQVKQRPMQSAEDRGVNTPINSPDPIRTLDTDGPRERSDLNQDENSREASLSIEALMEAL